MGLLFYAITFTVLLKKNRVRIKKDVLFCGQKLLNEWLKSRYIPHLNLDFIGLYLNSVLGQGAALRDLVTSFFFPNTPPSIYFP